MFRTLFLTLGLCVCVGPLTALAYDVVPLAHAPASGPVDTRPVNLQLSAAYGGESRPVALVSEPIWNKYSKRPFAYANTGIRPIDPALVVPVNAPAKYKPSYAPSRKSKARTSRAKTSSVKVAPQPSAARSGTVSAPQGVPVQRVTASTPPATPVVPQKVTPQNSSPTKNTGSPAVGNVPPSVPAPTVSGNPSRGTANIYEESAPAVGAAPDPDVQLATAPGTGTSGTMPPVAPLSPRKPSPVPSIAPDLTPKL